MTRGLFGTILVDEYEHFTDADAAAVPRWGRLEASLARTRLLPEDALTEAEAVAWAVCAPDWREARREAFGGMRVAALAFGVSAGILTCAVVAGLVFFVQWAGGRL